MCADGFLCDRGSGFGEAGEGGDRSEESRLWVIMETAVCHCPGVGERELCLPLGKVSDESVYQTITISCQASTLINADSSKQTLSTHWDLIFGNTEESIFIF